MEGGGVRKGGNGKKEDDRKVKPHCDTKIRKTTKQQTNKTFLKIRFLLQVGVSCPNHHVVDPPKT